MGGGVGGKERHEHPASALNWKFLDLFPSQADPLQYSYSLIVDSVASRAAKFHV